MLGYSSVEHMGILVLGIGLGGAAVWASLLHAVNNAFVKGLIFLVSGNLYQGFRSKKVENIQGVIHGFPATGIFLILGFIVIIGFPPFGIFYSELLILREAIITQHYWVVFFYFLFLSVLFFGYSRIVLGMALGRPPESANIETKKESFFMIAPLVILLVVLFFCGVFVPDSLYALINDAAVLLGGK
jgi:hydrogenase-4 component F